MMGNMCGCFIISTTPGPAEYTIPTRPTSAHGRFSQTLRKTKQNTTTETIPLNPVHLIGNSKTNVITFSTMHNPRDNQEETQHVSENAQFVPCTFFYFLFYMSYHEILASDFDRPKQSLLWSTTPRFKTSSIRRTALQQSERRNKMNSYDFVTQNKNVSQQFQSRIQLKEEQLHLRAFRRKQVQEQSLNIQRQLEIKSMTLERNMKVFYNYIIILIKH